MKVLIILALFIFPSFCYAGIGINVFSGIPSVELGIAIYNMKSYSVRPYGDVRISAPFADDEKIAINVGANFSINPTASIYLATGGEYLKVDGDNKLNQNVVFGISLLQSSRIGLNLGWSQLHKGFNAGITLIF